jgi:hypothetical protein
MELKNEIDDVLNEVSLLLKQKNQLVSSLTDLKNDNKAFEIFDYDLLPDKPDGKSNATSVPEISEPA